MRKLLVAVLFLFLSLDASAQFLINPDFGTGDFTGWTVSDGLGGLGGSYVQSGPFAPGTGVLGLNNFAVLKTGILDREGAKAAMGGISDAVFDFLAPDFVRGTVLSQTVKGVYDFVDLDYLYGLFTNEPLDGNNLPSKDGAIFLLTDLNDPDNNFFPDGGEFALGPAFNGPALTLNGDTYAASALEDDCGCGGGPLMGFNLLGTDNALFSVLVYESIDPANSSAVAIGDIQFCGCGDAPEIDAAGAKLPLAIALVCMCVLVERRRRKVA